METHSYTFDTNTVCLVGAIIMPMLSATTLVQLKQFSRFKTPLMSLACGLLFGAIGMGYLAFGIEATNTMPWLFAHMAGTVSYFFIVVSLVLLFRPDINPWKPSIILAVALLGTFMFPLGAATVIWTKAARMTIVGLAVWAAASTRNNETPVLQRVALWLSALAIAGMVPQLTVLVNADLELARVYNGKDSAAVIQALSWVISAVMSYVGITTIIQGRIAARLSHAADFDSLTQISNRRALMRHGEALIDNPKSMLMLIDVDHFKKINDQYGHLVGDAVLLHVASIIKKSVRSEDSVVGRYGGEEFCVMLNGPSKENALVVAERVREAVQDHPYQFEATSVHVSISVGLAPVPACKTLQGWLSQADECLYRAKAAGRNQVSTQLALAA
jgi:diguanylate cyclase (GGDEF)-like protein